MQKFEETYSLRTVLLGCLFRQGSCEPSLKPGSPWAKRSRDHSVDLNNILLNNVEDYKLLHVNSYYKENAMMRRSCHHVVSNFLLTVYTVDTAAT